MKNLVAIVILVFCFCLAGCSSTPFTPTSKPNPWQDDYLSVAPLRNYRSWGTYNVHDPSCRKIGDYYYMYSTDAIYFSPSVKNDTTHLKTGFIQVRRSPDLVHWEFVGWAFPEIPAEAVSWVKNHADGKGADNIWAPFIIPYQHKYRLYYCVSAFGRRTSYIGLAESTSPEGPWQQVGCVVKTDDTCPMNAIDPSVIADSQNGKWWMHYGSFFGGLYCVELNPQTGLALKDNDKGHLIARRANYQRDNQEAPEIIYQPELKKAFLFSSYDPLMTTYNVRVGRADKIEGPFYDFDNNNLQDTINHAPLLIAPYRFDKHKGWAGTGHCGIVSDEKGHYYMVHQGRLSPDNLMMDLHVRQLFFTPDGWPVVSPERYAASPERKFSSADLVGDWEIIHFKGPKPRTKLEAGQIMWGEGQLQEQECSISKVFTLKEDGEIGSSTKSDNQQKICGKWQYTKKKGLLFLSFSEQAIDNLIIFAGHDWERNTETILFTGLDKDGCAVWGKRIK